MMRQTTLLFLLLLLIGCSSGGGPPAPPPPRTGTVVNRYTGDPVEGATVRLYGMQNLPPGGENGWIGPGGGSSPPGEATTGPDGSFRLAVKYLPSGRLVLRIEGGGADWWQPLSTRDADLGTIRVAPRLFGGLSHVSELKILSPKEMEKEKMAGRSEPPVIHQVRSRDVHPMEEGGDPDGQVRILETKIPAQPVLKGNPLKLVYRRERTKSIAVRVRPLDLAGFAWVSGPEVAATSIEKKAVCPELWELDLTLEPGRYLIGIRDDGGDERHYTVNVE